MTKKTARYSEEFKVEAGKSIAEHNGNISAAARKLGIPMQTRTNWQNKAKQSKLKGTKQYDPELMALIEDNKQLKRKLKIAEEESEILEKATAYFAKNG